MFIMRGSGELIRSYLKPVNTILYHLNFFSSPHFDGFSLLILKFCPVCTTCAFSARNWQTYYILGFKKVKNSNFQNSSPVICCFTSGVRCRKLSIPAQEAKKKRQFREGEKEEITEFEGWKNEETNEKRRIVMYFRPLALFRWIWL